MTVRRSTDDVNRLPINGYGRAVFIAQDVMVVTPTVITKIVGLTSESNRAPLRKPMEQTPI